MLTMPYLMVWDAAARQRYVVYTELNNNVTFTRRTCYAATGDNMNHCVPLLLALHLGGDDAAAGKIFKQMLSFWDGVGFGPLKNRQYQARVKEAHSSGLGVLA